MSRSIALLAALALSLTASCGGGGDPKEDGFSALQSGDHAGAAKHFQAALDARTSADADFVEVAVARCQALAHTDADAAKAEFMKLAGANGTKLEINDYTIVISELQSAGNFLQAIDVLDVAIKKNPEAPKLVKVKDKLVAESQKNADPAVLEKLKGLGYL